MQIQAAILNAFTKNGQGGNPAGVVLGLKGKVLSDKEMQLISLVWR